MAIQDAYEGPQDDAKSLATQDQIDDLQAQIDELKERLMEGGISELEAKAIAQQCINDQPGNRYTDVQINSMIAAWYQLNHQDNDRTDAEINGLIAQWFIDNNPGGNAGRTDAEINALIQSWYQANHSDVDRTDAEIESLISAWYQANHSDDDRTDAQVQALVEGYLLANPEYICHPASGDGIPVQNPTGTLTTIDITHPAIDCRRVCVKDKLTNQWTTVGTEIISDTVTRTIWRVPPADDRFCVFVMGRPA